jgi:signal transduction histidine kinase/ActR/RegA family two-component response regulator
MTARAAHGALAPDAGLPRLSAWHRRLIALLGWIGAATFLTLLVWSAHPWFISQASHPDVSFAQERFRQLPTPSHPGSDWLDVTLPDTWAERGLPGGGVGRYEITFQLARPPSALGDGPWAVRFDRISFQHRIWLNGQLIHAETVGAAGPTGRPLAYMMQIPRELLREGPNRLAVEVHHGSMGGLSTPIIGLAADVAPGFTAQSFLTEGLPLAVNVVAAAFAAFLTLIWLRRRQEVGMGMLGLLAMVVSIRNSAYYVVNGPTIPPQLSAWMYFSAQTTATVLLGAFAMAIADKDWPWFRKVLWGTLIGAPLLGAIAASHGVLPQVRAIVYPAMLLLMLPTLTLLLRVPAKFGGWSGRGMVLGIAISLVAGVHDYLRLQGMVSVMHTYWMSLATPITLASYGVALMNRFIEAVGEVEQHNVQLERKVAERTEDLAAANAAKGQFLAAASHDLRQPVAAVGLLSGLLRERLKDSPLKDMTDRLAEAVRAMENLLSGLLDLSRLEAKAIRPHWQGVALGDLLRRIATHEEPAAKAKGVRLKLRPTQAVAESDPVLLEQMVRNLVGNAVRYTQRGGVLVGVRRRGQRLSIQVWDTGGGIAPADQQRIFKDFVQLANPERNQAKGLGLGLSIVQRASQLLDHPIGLRSRVGHGSCFSIDVPAHQGQIAMAAPSVVPIAELTHDAPPAPPPSTEAERPLQDRHIVVLDDDASVRQALTERLRAWGAYVSAVDSVEALDELLQRVMSIDMLVTDHRLCDGDGFQAIGLARAIHPQLAAMVITGDTASEQLQTLLSSGIPVLHKPFQADALLEVIVLQLGVTSPRCSSA